MDETRWKPAIYRQAELESYYAKPLRWQFWQWATRSDRWRHHTSLRTST